MLSDGMIGSKAVALALSSFATGNLNAKLKQGATPFRMPDILPSLADYITPPKTDAEKAEDARASLLAFMSQMPGSEGFF